MIIIQVLATDGAIFCQCLTATALTNALTVRHAKISIQAFYRFPFSEKGTGSFPKTVSECF